jgi:hypothetical protein
MMVWMLVNNPNRGFYEGMGGRRVGTKPIMLGTTTIEEIAYEWDDLEATLQLHCPSK